ncbi:hypothetical protein D9619_004873 [Psilocybe cf. subviscida]|uniref:cellulase n=1 Tax=Psilocybe cf. subviscida TaxID=2480587 RepID=A0A8H5BPX1_9AGAR|nr:hypothetical protein D9619_004873 [Psilocybe cf. subviscida]
MQTSFSSIASLAVLIALSKPVLSVAVWGQCGGIGYSGQTLCNAGSTCTYSNAYYSQCLPLSAAPPKDVVPPAPKPSPSACDASKQVDTVPVWGQCGGLTHTGSTVCDDGAVCEFLNAFYSQCHPQRNAGSPATTVKTTSSTISKVATTSTTEKTVTATSAAPTTVKTTTVTLTSSVATSSVVSTASTTIETTTTTSSAPTSTNSICPGNLTKFKYFGVNEAGAEFASAFPGTLGKDYIWPTTSSIDFFLSEGFNTIRIPFMLERLTPVANGLTGAFDATYLAALKSVVNHITGKGAFAIIEPHNYMRYNHNVITSTSDFSTWWKNLASEFKSNSKVIFDVMNEPNGIDAATVFALNQAAVNGIRVSGATTQLITVEGTAWTGAWSWVSSGNAAVFGAIKDPNNNVAIQMHQYLDGDASGTSDSCVSPTIGAERLAAATTWLKQNNLKGFLGEIGGGSNSQCIKAIQSALCAMQQSDVWVGAVWWAAGPWWGDYFQSMEPPNGAAISAILPQALKPFL